jgi:hypothetical protein
VTRSDLILVGHPHFDHVADTARVARQTGAPVAIAPTSRLTPASISPSSRFNGLPHVAQQLEEVFLPVARLYQPKVLVPAHHDELWVNFGGGGLARLFSDVATEPIKNRVHDELPETVTVQPGLIEPLTVDRAKGDISLGEIRLQ